MYLVLIGPPGAGKGTQSKLLVDHLGIPHFSTGDLLRQACAEGTEVGRQAQSYLEAGELVPDPLMEEIVQHRLSQPDCVHGCLFDGFPRTVRQAEALQQILARRGTPLDVVLELQVDREELVKRLTGRARNDDKPAIIRHRLDAFNDCSQELLDFYNRQSLLCTIDGHGATEEVFERIRQALPREKDRPAAASKSRNLRR